LLLLSCLELHTRLLAHADVSVSGASARPPLEWNADSGQGLKGLNTSLEELPTLQLRDAGNEGQMIVPMAQVVTIVPPPAKIAIRDGIGISGSRPAIYKTLEPRFNEPMISHEV
jgi:hypothetical protein